MSLIKQIMVVAILITAFTFTANATHIVGGELTYRCLGSNQYEVTLKLYRNCYDPCGTCSYPNPANVDIYDASGSQVSTLSMSFPGADTLDLTYGNICFVPPTDVCVQEAIYVDTITLAPTTAEYFMAFNICCRNGSIININNPLNTEATYLANIKYTVVPGPEGPLSPTIETNVSGGDFGPWEDLGFVGVSDDIWDTVACPSMANNDNTDHLFATGYGFTVPANAVIEGFEVTVEKHASVLLDTRDDDAFMVKGGIIVGTDHRDLTDWPTTDAVFTYGGPTDLWGSTWTAADVNAGNFGFAINARKSVSGTTDVDFFIDHITITVYYTEYIDICNSSPEFNNFPPVFVCLGDTLTFDNSAEDTLTDPDGDSLVYTLCTPYDDYGSGTDIPPNLVTWDGAYSETYQLSGDSIKVDPVTGEITAYPTILGQYLLGVCVSEFRADTLLSVTQRDFQFNVVDCVPIVAAAVPAFTPPCGLDSVRFVNDSVGAFTQLWDFGVPIVTTDTSTLASPVFTFPDTGTYTITLIINAGMSCVDTGTTTIVIRRSVDADFALDNICTGTVVNYADSSTVSMGTLNNWQWTFAGGTPATSNAQNPTVTYGSAGTYSTTLIAMSDSGCSDTVLIPVTIVDPPTVDAGVDISNCSGSSGVIGGTPTASGGGTSYTYVWDNTGSLDNGAIANPTANPVATTTYSITVTDNNSCSGIDNITVTVGAGPTIDAGPNQSGCTGAGIQIGGLPTASGGTSPYTYTWDNTATLDNGSIANPTATPGITTIYTVTVTDMAGCSAIDNVTVTVDPGVLADAGTSSSLCGGGNLLIGGTPTSTGGGAPHSYVWDNSGTLDDPTIANPTATPVINTVYTVTVTNTFGCTSTDNITVSVGASPTVNPGSSAALCTPVSHLLGGLPTASGGASPYTYLWNNAGSLSSSTSSNPVATPFTSTIYKVTVTDNGGCSTIASVQLIVSFSPGAQPGSDLIVCDGDSVQLGDVPSVLSGTAPFTYTWSPAASLNDPTSPNPMASPSVPTTYYFTVTDAVGCTDSASLNVTISSFPSANAGPDQLSCTGISTTLGGAPTGAGGTTPYTYSWSNPSNLNNGTIANPDAIVTVSTSFSVTVTSADGCTATDVALLSITAPPNANANAGADITACDNLADVALNATITNAGGGAWVSSGDGTFDDINSLTALYTLGPNDVSSGNVDLVLLTTGNGLCPGDQDTVTVYIVPSPVVNAGNDTVACPDLTPLAITGIINGGSIDSWTTSGTGSFGDPNALITSYTPTIADTLSGSVTLTLSSLATASCAAETDDVIITFSSLPIVVAGNDTTICNDAASLSLSGAVSMVGTGVWSSSGSGTFSPNANDLNATYNISASDLLSGQFDLVLTSIGGCVENADTISVTVIPFVNVGTDTIVCAGTTSLPVNGIMNGATGVIWSSTGDGAFADNLALSTTYILGANDITTGTFELIIVTTGNGTCLEATDTIFVTTLPAPTSSIVSDTTVCKSQLSIDFVGSVTNASGGGWSTSGFGTFSPDSALNTTYWINPADTALDSVIVTMITLGSCTTDTSIAVINWYPPVTVYAGGDQVVCATNGIIPVSGNVVGAAGGMWTSTGLGFFASPTSLGTTYTMNAADTVAGFVGLVLSSTGNGNCMAVSDTAWATIDPAPIVFAGIDFENCAALEPISISGTVTHASGGLWSAIGSGVIDNPNLLSTTYTPNVFDTAAGYIDLILTSTGNGLCGAEDDTVRITFIGSPIVDAGLDQTQCVDVTGVVLDGSVSGTPSSIWSTTGSGAFMPDSSIIDATYIPSTADTVSGSVTLILTGVGNGACSSVSDSLDVVFNAGPLAQAGPFQVICGDTVSINLAGSINFAAGGVWTTSGTGTFSDSSDVNTIYSASSADTASGSFYLILSTTGNGICPPDVDSILITYPPSPEAFAGPDGFVCTTNPDYQLGGGYLETSGGQWTSTGTGVFSPNDSDLTAIYQPSDADTAVGSVFIMLTAAAGNQCPAYTDSLLLTLTPDMIQVNAGQDSILCADSVALNGAVQIANGGVWSTNGTGTFTPNDSTLNAVYHFTSADTAAGSVTLTLTTTGNGGCNARQDSVTYTIQEYITVTAMASDTICGDGSPVQLVGTSSTLQGQWTSVGGGLFAPDDLDPNATYTASAADVAAGTATIIYSSLGNGLCASTMDSVTVNIIDQPIINFTSNVTCANDSAMFTDISSSPDGITGWNWYFGDGDSSNVQNPAHLYGAEGVFNVTMTVVSNFGCMDTLVQSISIDPTPLANFSSDAGCYVDSVSFTDLSTVSSGAITTWEWDFGNGNNANTQHTSESYINDGVYFVTLIVTSDQGCIDSIIQNITVEPGPKALFSVSTGCIDDTIYFTNTSTIATGSITNWEWLVNGSSVISEDLDILFPTDSTYDVTLIVTSDNGCIDSITMPVDINPSPIADYSVAGLCIEEGATFTDLSIINGATITNWEWDFGNGSQSIDQNPANLYTAAGTYGITLIVATDQGCTDTLESSYTTATSPIAAFTADPPIVLVDEGVQFENNSVGGSAWVWEFGDQFGESTLENPLYMYADTGYYIVQLIAINELGCPDTVSNNIYVTMPPLVPTGFTPNGDGQNDVLYVTGGPYTDLDFKVYNNWGELIFESYNQGFGWDGTRDGIPQPIGVYIFTVEAVTLEGVIRRNEKGEIIHGDVTLLR